MLTVELDRNLNVSASVPNQIGVLQSGDFVVGTTLNLCLPILFAAAASVLKLGPERTRSQAISPQSPIPPIQAEQGERSRGRSCKRSLLEWAAVLVSLAVLLVAEYFLNQTPFFMNGRIGRYLYCLLVLFGGIGLTKVVVAVAHFRQPPPGGAASAAAAAVAASSVDSAMCVTRQVCVVVVNTMLAIMFRGLTQYPLGGAAMQSSASVARYLQEMAAATREATFFLWTAILGSQCLGFANELLCAHIVRRGGSTPLFTLTRDSVLYKAMEALTVKALYLSQENWFLLSVLFCYTCCFGWLNPFVYLLGGACIAGFTAIQYLRLRLLRISCTPTNIPNTIPRNVVVFTLFLYIMHSVVLLPLLFLPRGMIMSKASKASPPTPIPYTVWHSFVFPPLGVVVLAIPLWLLSRAFGRHSASQSVKTHDSSEALFPPATP